MKNSMILKIASALCVANVILSLGLFLSIGSARARITLAENTIDEVKQSLEALKSTLKSETESRMDENNVIKSELRSISRALIKMSNSSTSDSNPSSGD